MNPPRRLWILGSMALLAVAGGIGAFMAGDRAKPSASPSLSPPQGPAASNHSDPRRAGGGPASDDNPAAGRSQPSPPPEGVLVPAPVSVLEQTAGPLKTSSEAIKEAIHEAAISYDPKSLPQIQPYLLHPDPDVRAAALDGMLVLGDAAASPLLRAAAKEITAPQEAVKLLEAADYLELPSGSFRRGAGAQGASRPAVRQVRPAGQMRHKEKLAK